MMLHIERSFPTFKILLNFLKQFGPVTCGQFGCEQNPQ